MNKLRNVMAVSLLVFAMNSAQVFADEAVPVKNNDIIQTTQQVAGPEQPAVNLDLKNQDKDKNILPVMELKGGVKQAEQEKPSLLKTWLEGNYATGEWGGLRSKLEEHGVTLSGSYTNFGFMRLSGGKSSSSKPEYEGIVLTTAEFDTKKLGLWGGGRAVVTYGNAHGRGISSDYIGDYQLINTYDCRRFSQLYAYYYEQKLLRDKLKVKIGKQDANEDFVVLDSAFQFMNGGFFIQNTPIPTYPSPALGALVTIQPVNWFSIKSGIYDGNAEPKGLGFKTLFNGRDNYTIMNEAAITPNFNNHKGKYSVGHWISTNDFAEITGNEDEARTFKNAYGLYAGFEQMLFKENNNADDNQGLTVFGQFGWSPSDRRQISKYFGGGVVYKGLIPKRNEDIIGVATNFARFSQRAEVPHGESVVESFYKFQLTPWLALQPDFQFIYKPSGVYKNSCAIGLKTVITF